MLECSPNFRSKLHFSKAHTTLCLPFYTQRKHCGYRWTDLALTEQMQTASTRTWEKPALFTEWKEILWNWCEISVCLFVLTTWTAMSGPESRLCEAYSMTILSVKAWDCDWHFDYSFFSRDCQGPCIWMIHSGWWSTHSPAGASTE